MAKAVEVFNVLSKMCDAKYRGRPFLPRLRREYQSHTASIERTVTADDGRIRPPLASLASREANHGRRHSSVGDGLWFSCRIAGYRCISACRSRPVGLAADTCVDV